VNIEFLHTLVIEELRNLYDADSQLSAMLPKMERASLSSEVEKAVHRRRELSKIRLAVLKFWRDWKSSRAADIATQ
jgi:ferritin-like metal-binding protein YciE